jgi:hypothetical protein
MLVSERDALEDDGHVQLKTILAIAAVLLLVGCGHETTPSDDLISGGSILAGEEQELSAYGGGGLIGVINETEFESVQITSLTGLEARFNWTVNRVNATHWRVSAVIPSTLRSTLETQRSKTCGNAGWTTIKNSLNLSGKTATQLCNDIKNFENFPTASPDGRVSFENVKANLSTGQIEAEISFPEGIVDGLRASLGFGTVNLTATTYTTYFLKTRRGVCRTSNNYIHVLYPGTQTAIYYARSTDGGASFTVNTTAFTGAGAGNKFSQSIDCEGSTVVAFFHNGSTNVQVWKSTNNGDSWSNVHTRAETVLTGYNAQIRVKGNEIYAYWWGATEENFLNSSDGGTSWTYTNLTNLLPSLSDTSGGADIFIDWKGNTDPTDNRIIIGYRRPSTNAYQWAVSLNGGSTWTNSTTSACLSQTGGHLVGVQNNGRLWQTSGQDTGTSCWVYAHYSDDNASTWTTSYVHQSVGQNAFTTAAMDDDTGYPHVIYETGILNTNKDIRYAVKNSTSNPSILWNLTNDALADTTPSAVHQKTNGTIDFVWLRGTNSLYHSYIDLTNKSSTITGVPSPSTTIPAWGSTVECRAVYTGKDSGGNVSFIWYKNGAVEPYHNSSVSVSGQIAVATSGSVTANTSNLGSWICSARSYNGSVYSGYVNSTPVTISDSVPPQYALGAISGNITYGANVSLLSNWTDNVNLSTARLFWNARGYWEQLTSCTLTGTSSSCNVSKNVTGYAGQVCWFAWANDTTNNINAIGLSTPACFNITTPSYTVTMTAPTTASPASVTGGESFTANFTVSNELGSVTGGLGLWNATIGTGQLSFEDWDRRYKGQFLSRTSILNTSTSLFGGPAFSRMVWYDRHTNRWYTFYIDTAYDIRALWSENGYTIGQDQVVIAGTWTDDDYDVWLTDHGTYSRLHVVYTDSTQEYLDYIACNITTSTSLACSASQRIYLASSQGNSATDDVAHPAVAADSQNCLLVAWDFEDDSEATADEHEVVFIKENSTDCDNGGPDNGCGDGVFNRTCYDAGFPIYSVQTDVLGYNAEMLTGIVPYGDLDAQVFWSDTDSSTAVEFATIFYNGTTRTFPSAQVALNADVETDLTNQIWLEGAVIVTGNTTIGFAVVDAATTITAYILDGKTDTTSRSVSTGITIPTTSTNHKDPFAGVVDTRSNGGDDVYLFALNGTTGTTKLVVVNSTNAGTTWGTVQTLSTDVTGAPDGAPVTGYLSAGFSNETCDIVVRYETNSLLYSTRNGWTWTFNTGSCNTAKNLTYSGGAWHYNFTVPGGMTGLQNFNILLNDVNVIFANATKTETSAFNYGGAGDPCAYTSGTWNLPCGCNLTSPQGISGNAIVITGSGVIRVEAAITGVTSITSPNTCDLLGTSSGYIGT